MTCPSSSEGLANAGTDVDHLFASLEKGSGSTQGFYTDLIKTNEAAQRVGATYGITAEPHRLGHRHHRQRR